MSRITPSTSYDYVKMERAGTTNNRKMIPAAGRWWIGESQGESRLFITCNDCGSAIMLAKEYLVHPKGYLRPCVMCPECDEEGYRFLCRWKPVRTFTPTQDWKNRKKLLERQYNTSFTDYIDDDDNDRTW